MKKLFRALKDEKIQIILKYIVFVLVLGLFFLGEYFKKHGGHPLWYWIIMGLVILFGLFIVSLSVYTRNKTKQIPKDDSDNIDVNKQ